MIWFGLEMKNEKLPNFFPETRQVILVYTENTLFAKLNE